MTENKNVVAKDLIQSHAIKLCRLYLILWNNAVKLWNADFTGQKRAISVTNAPYYLINPFIKISIMLTKGKRFNIYEYLNKYYYLIDTISFKLISTFFSLWLKITLKDNTIRSKLSFKVIFNHTSKRQFVVLHFRSFFLNFENFFL